VTRVRDVLIVGGGPAGLAVAIAAAQQRLDVLVLERRPLPADKACGEGILPGGVRALASLGVLEHIPVTARSPISAIRWIDGASSVAAPLPAPGGLGVRRTALSAALLERARQLGVEVRTGVQVVGHQRRSDAVCVRTDQPGEERLEGRLLVAADGLRSPIAARERLARTPGRPARFGVRRHFLRPPWTSAVEVHLGDGVEAYVTPTDPGRVGVALLCEERARAGFDDLLGRFPQVAARLAGCPVESRAMGAGPFPRAVRARSRDRLVLVGDAAGYEDAITGDGLSLAFTAAADLGDILPAALAAGASRHAFARWERSSVARYRRYLIVTRATLALARHQAARRRVLWVFGRSPRLLGGLVGLSTR
jgi:flavin-dependent dehydrogenase